MQVLALQVARVPCSVLLVAGLTTVRVVVQGKVQYEVQ